MGRPTSPTLSLFVSTRTVPEIDAEGMAVGDPDVETLVAPGTAVTAGDPDVGAVVPPTGVDAEVEGTLSTTKSTMLMEFFVL